MTNHKSFTRPKRRLKNRFACLIASSIALILTANLSIAQIEEVIITARKRAESLQDVPLAVSAINGDSIQKEGLPDLQAVALSIPNFHQTEAVVSSDIFIMRGVGTAGSNISFEQAVGQVFNGFFYGRSRFGRAMFLDLERLEVLKGPQGALIGKNTTAGAINITSKKPTEEFEAYLNASYDFKASKGYTLEGVVSGPITDTVRARIALRKDDRDGWMENVNTGTPESIRDDLTVRALVDIDFSDTISGEFLWQKSDLLHQGRNREWSECSPANAAEIVAADPRADCKFDGKRSTIFVWNGEERSEDHNTNNEVFGFTLNADFEDFTVTSLTNYTDLNAFDIWDIDQSSRAYTNTSLTEDFQQFSQEVRIASNGAETLDYIAGIYYQNTELFYSQPFEFLRGPHTGFRNNESTQDTETKAVFAQVDWHLNEEWTITVGGRYTDETKDSTTSSWYSEVFNPSNLYIADGLENTVTGWDGTVSVFPGNPNLGFAKLVNGPTVGNDTLRGSHNETDFSPNASVQWKFNDDQMFYFNYSQGFKSGGFDLQKRDTKDTAFDTWQFDPEQSIHYELGGKHDLLESTLRFNWAVFNTEFSDMQVTALDGITLIQVTTNASNATTQGAEVDIQWSPNDVFNLSFAAGITDAKFDEFSNAPCWAGQTAEQGCTDGQQDISGRQLPFSSDLSYTVEGDYTFHLENGMELKLWAQYLWIDEMMLQLDLDPLDYQEAYGKVNARISLTGNDEKWSVSLVGRNLTDEYTTGYSSDTAALVPTASNGTHFKFLDETRAIGIQARINFE